MTRPNYKKALDDLYLRVYALGLKAATLREKAIDLHDVADMLYHFRASYPKETSAILPTRGS